jgi:FixJ family two-component response regulator
VPNTSTIAVVDNDLRVREALLGLLKAAGFAAEAFGSAEEFLGSGRLTTVSCVIVDLRMPGMSGNDLQERLIASGCAVPIIVMTGYGDVERVRALERGAIACLQKPFDDEALLAAVAKATGASS